MEVIQKQIQEAIAAQGVSQTDLKQPTFLQVVSIARALDMAVHLEMR